MSHPEKAVKYFLFIHHMLALILCMLSCSSFRHKRSLVTGKSWQPIKGEQVQSNTTIKLTGEWESPKQCYNKTNADCKIFKSLWIRMSAKCCKCNECQSEYDYSGFILVECKPIYPCCGVLVTQWWSCFSQRTHESHLVAKLMCVLFYWITTCAC